MLLKPKSEVGQGGKLVAPNSSLRAPLPLACTGIEKHGIIEVEGERIYAYEVDGMGNHLADFDDANGACTGHFNLLPCTICTVCVAPRPGFACPLPTQPLQFGEPQASIPNVPCPCAVPSLLSIPLLGWSRYDKKVYGATRRRLLSPKNSHYFKGPELRGIGSPHTPTGYVWPIALAGTQGWLSI